MRHTFGLKLLSATHYVNNNTSKVLIKKVFSTKYIKVSLFKQQFFRFYSDRDQSKRGRTPNTLTRGLMWMSSHSEGNARTVSQTGPGPLMFSCHSELQKTSLYTKAVHKFIPENKQHHMQMYGGKDIASLTLNLGTRGRSVFKSPSVAVPPSFQSEVTYYHI